MLTKKNFFDKLGRANQTHFSMNNPQPEPQKVYVTGYALTSGVFLVEAEISECGRFARAKNQFGLNTAYTLGKSAFFSVEEAKAIFEKRKAFLADFVPIFNAYHQTITDSAETVQLVYQSDLFEKNTLTLLEENLSKDRALQYTSVGIHKDDLSFEIENCPLEGLG